MLSEFYITCPQCGHRYNVDKFDIENQANHLNPAEFQYHRPRNVDQVLELLKQVGDAGKILTGGQSLMPLMNFRLAEPVHLIDIIFIAGLDYIRQGPHANLLLSSYAVGSPAGRFFADEQNRLGSLSQHVLRS